jgi:hypothetical protein
MRLRVAINEKHQPRRRGLKSETKKRPFGVGWMYVFCEVYMSDPNIPNFDFKNAYIELREVWDDPKIQKALMYAHNNPHAVYRKGTPEYDAVRHGFFSALMYRSLSNSTAEDD